MTVAPAQRQHHRAGNCGGGAPFLARSVREKWESRQHQAHLPQHAAAIKQFHPKRITLIKSGIKCGDSRPRLSAKRSFAAP
jgi:hypothetical protein